MFQTHVPARGSRPLSHLITQQLYKTGAETPPVLQMRTLRFRKAELLAPEAQHPKHSLQIEGWDSCLLDFASVSHFKVPDE